MFEKWIRAFNNNTTIRKKITYLFIPLIIILVFVFEEVSNYLYQDTILKLSKEQLNQNTKALRKDLEFRISLCEKISQNIYTNNDVRAVLLENRKTETNTGRTMNEIKDSHNIIDEIFTRNLFDERQINITLYVDKSFLVNDGMYVKYMGDLPDSKILADVMEKHPKIGLSVGEVSIDRRLHRRLILSRAILEEATGELLAVLNVEIETGVIEEIIKKNIDIGEEGWFTYRFKDGKDIISSLTGEKNLKRKYIEDSFEYKNTVFEVGYSEVLVNKMAVNIRKLIIIITCIFMVAAVIIAFLFSKLISKRIVLFIDKIKHLDSVNLVPIGGSDEIATIDNNFNKMMEKLNENIYREYILKAQKNAIETELLQVKFNPHFLYNTLSAIRWSVIKQGDIEAAGALDNLVNFYRSVLSGGKNIITVSRELQIIKNYIEIQKYTYDKQYTVEYIIEQGVEELYCLKFLLQPIIENAIIHGIVEKEDKGIIWISVRRIGGNLQFSIHDNGTGMKAEIVDKLNSIDMDWENLSSSTSELGGYGVLNVIKRIKLYYGKEYGILYESRCGEGTKVTITIPVCYGEKDNVVILA